MSQAFLQARFVSLVAQRLPITQSRSCARRT